MVEPFALEDFGFRLTYLPAEKWSMFITFARSSLQLLKIFLSVCVVATHYTRRTLSLHKALEYRLTTPSLSYVFLAVPITAGTNTAS